MIVYRTNDMDAISKILKHPRVYNMVSDDLAPDLVRPCDGLYIVNADQTGMVRADHVNGICCSVHIATIPEMWGKAVDFAKSVIYWGFEHTTYTKIIALIPEYNHLALRLCKKCHFRIEGNVKKSFLKDWKYHNQHLLGLTKTEFYKGETLCHP